MWAVDLRQSHEIPETWIDLNSVLKQKKTNKKKGRGGTPTPPIAKTGLRLENKPTRELWEWSKYLEKGPIL